MQATEIEEQILHQKAKVEWLKHGDGNTTYFHATVRGENRITGIYNLEDSNGRRLSNQPDIENEVIHFYENLIGKSTSQLKHVDITVLRNGTQLEDKDRDTLVQPITDQEIWKELGSIGDTKAPGVDGFSEKFFKAAWNVVGGDVKRAIHDFFFSGKDAPCH
ncbi:uncharacterized protein LOC131648910 [Vicia villosa]|uniref:uncharacterized protein LOC131648910 n=1 Tax=Vicia villosa TaxID=3911 RepID=UPI00273BA929|nr:uncharacterized protein LOC131648910 [Vicia villosa]